MGNGGTIIRPRRSTARASSAAAASARRRRFVGAMLRGFPRQIHLHQDARPDAQLARKGIELLQQVEPID